MSLHIQYGVQAAAPLKDSGNDLVALKGYAVKTIQVKTCKERFRTPVNLPEKYHLLALVKLLELGGELLLDETKVYLVPKHRVENLSINREIDMAGFLISQNLVDELFIEA